MAHINRAMVNCSVMTVSCIASSDAGRFGKGECRCDVPCQMTSVFLPVMLLWGSLEEPLSSSGSSTMSTYQVSQQQGRSWGMVPRGKPPGARAHLQVPTLPLHGVIFHCYRALPIHQRKGWCRLRATSWSGFACPPRGSW